MTIKKYNNYSYNVCFVVVERNVKKESKINKNLEKLKYDIFKIYVFKLLESTLFYIIMFF